ncbi:hypothetical protein [Stenotrophomonas sp. 57]|uniref:hypothetical protein n=1 Tax=Stenotrophomonas sp. 57 TaxID=3051119 RepID=UPI00256F33A6|nr:hypothetical protein [Stenotrophomonas sp. 57]
MSPQPPHVAILIATSETGMTDYSYHDGHEEAAARHGRLSQPGAYQTKNAPLRERFS